MMKAFKYLFLVMLSLIISGCADQESPNPFTPRVIAITVADMAVSMDWYTSNLGFIKDTIASYGDYGLTVGMMHQGDFSLELVQFDQGISKNELKFPEGFSELNGYFKIGFQAKDIEALYESLQALNVNIAAPLSDLPPQEGYDWPEKYFLITDPDGNYIQFFSSTSQTLESSLYPFLIALSTPDIDASLSWYQKHLKAMPMGPKVGQPGNERALINIDGFVIELGEFAGHTNFESVEAPENIERSQVHGVAKLSFLSNDISGIYQYLKTQDITFDFDLTETNSSMADRYFMIQDLTGNSLQFFEKK